MFHFFYLWNDFANDILICSYIPIIHIQLDPKFPMVLCFIFVIKPVVTIMFQHTQENEGVFFNFMFIEMRKR